jgi:predicted DNA binding CopG/RHH family protein
LKTAFPSRKLNKKYKGTQITKIKLNKFEQDIENNILEYKTVSIAKNKNIKNLIEKSNVKEKINLSINTQDLKLLKIRAEHQGISYKTLVSSIIHRFVTE